MDKSPIALTFDSDWINNEHLLELIETLKKNQLKATFFITGKYDCFKKPDPLFEINPHFRFNGDWTDYEESFKQFRSIAPLSIGIRNHSLYFHERIRVIWQNEGIKYSSNNLQPLVENLRPYNITKKIIEIPIYFLDYWFMEFSGPHPKLKLSSLKLNRPGLKVFDFHPIHLDLNTPNLKYYEKYKHLFSDKLKTQNTHPVRYEGNGMSTLFQNLIKYITSNKIKTYKLKEIYQKYEKKL